MLELTKYKRYSEIICEEYDREQPKGTSEIPFILTEHNKDKNS